MKSNDTWEDSSQHRLSPYGRPLKDEPEGSNGRSDILWKGLALAVLVVAASLILVLLAGGWRP